MLARFRSPVIASVVLLLAALVVVACSAPAQSPQPQAPGQAAPAAAKTAEPPGAAALQGAEKDRVLGLIEAAKKEGEVGWRATLVKDATAKALADAFRSYYGLPSDFKVSADTDMAGNALTTKTVAELEAGKLTVDIISTGVLALLYDLLAKNELTKYDSPVYKAYGPAAKAGITEPGYWVADAYTFGPMWNTQLVPKGINTWEDFLDPAYQDKVSTLDIVGSDIGSAVYLAVKSVAGPEFWPTLAKRKFMIILRADENVAKAITGERPLGITMPSRVYQVGKTGAPVAVSFPEKGLLLVPQPWVIMAKAPHPNAAKLWVDFIFSERGQQVYQTGEALFSGREGFSPPADVAKFAQPIDKIKAIPFDWKKHNVAQSSAAKAEAKQIIEAAK